MTYLWRIWLAATKTDIAQIEILNIWPNTSMFIHNLLHLVMCEHLTLRIEKEQLLKTVDPFEDGRSGN